MPARAWSLNRMPNSSSIPKMMLTCASESHPGTSAARVSAVSEISSLFRSERTTCSIRSRVADWFVPGLDEFTGNRAFLVDVILPRRRARVARPERKSEAFEDVLHDDILRRRDERSV